MSIERRILTQPLLCPICPILGLVMVFLSCEPPHSPQGENTDFRPVRVVGRFPPIMEFPIRSVREARTALNPSDLVIGVEVGKEARAYPVNMLTGPRREILNDTA